MDNTRSPSRPLALAGLLALALVACVSELKPLAPLPEGAPITFPEDVYRRAGVSGSVYRIDPGASQVLIYVYRDGRLAKFGHDHAVASRDVRGYALLPDNLAVARADLYFPAATLSVDEPDLRANAGFTTELSSDDIETTRRRMLQTVLEAEKYPHIQVHAAPAPGAPPRLTLNVDLTLHGVTRAFQVPIELTVNGGKFSVQGEFDIRQTDFAITPFSALGGALAVKDQLHIIFHLQGERVGFSG